jgi:Fe-Mn family superoxide dismutase
MENKFYLLPELTYNYDELAPYISADQLKIHHQKHHNSYVTGANAILEKFEKARQENSILDYKAESKSLSFNIGGHILHSLFWKNMTPVGRGGKIAEEISLKIKEDFGSFERFKNEFTTTALGVEGSGWGALIYLPEINRLMAVQIEKHNLLLIPGAQILLVIDVFEHAYYLDYKNERAKFIENFWHIINWEEVNNRFLKVEK